MEDVTQATPEVSSDLNDIDVSDLDFGRADEEMPIEETETEGEATPEAEAADQQEQTEGEADAEDAETEEKTDETDQLILKHLGETKVVSRDEAVTLAQKGLDYDRLKSKSEERYTVLEERIAIFDEIAKQSGFENVDELADYVMAETIAKRDGMSKEAALKQVQLEKRERQVEQREQKVKSKSKIDSDAREFLAKYPKIDFDTIPPEVWDKVNAGDSLVSAYGEYTAETARQELAAENEKLKLELEAAKKNSENKQRSTGSATSAGKDSVKDPWLNDLVSRIN